MRPGSPTSGLHIWKVVIEEMIAFTFCENDPKYKYVLWRQVVKFLKVWRDSWVFFFNFKKETYAISYICVGGHFYKSNMKKNLCEREEFGYPESYICEASCSLCPLLSLSFWTCLAGSTVSPGSDAWRGVAAVIRTGDGYVRSNIFSHKRGEFI